MDEITEKMIFKIKARISKCFLCKWIAQDLEANGGKLKGWNLDLFGHPIFDRDAELMHLRLEGIPFVEAEL